MIMRRSLTILLLAIACNAHGQLHMTNFCEAVDTIMKLAPDHFRPIMGKVMSTNSMGTMWASTIKIPNTVGYRIVQSNGMYYEAAVEQTTDKDALMPDYERTKEQITECLKRKGNYRMTTQENFTAGLSKYPKVVWMIPPKEGVSADELPPHLAMEVTYDKSKGKFTLIMYIFQH